ncbi:unnamed protein product [Moneuplotes crassus]|uniref:Uncharacterized protein n=1 Tax=Euplotes crassus TaxID=5936 RepID=A0AAD2D076_EUPCR|nr:unnamed protein product [Moneuplotes crassus]
MLVEFFRSIGANCECFGYFRTFFKIWSGFNIHCNDCMLTLNQHFKSCYCSYLSIWNNSKF